MENTNAKTTKTMSANERLSAIADKIKADNAVTVEKKGEFKKFTLKDINGYEYTMRLDVGGCQELDAIQKSISSDSKESSTLVAENIYNKIDTPVVKIKEFDFTSIIDSLWNAIIDMAKEDNEPLDDLYEKTILFLLNSKGYDSLVNELGSFFAKNQLFRGSRIHKRYNKIIDTFNSQFYTDKVDNLVRKDIFIDAVADSVKTNSPDISSGKDILKNMCSDVDDLFSIIKSEILSKNEYVYQQYKTKIDKITSFAQIKNIKF